MEANQTSDRWRCTIVIKTITKVITTITILITTITIAITIQIIDLMKLTELAVSSLVHLFSAMLVPSSKGI